MSDSGREELLRVYDPGFFRELAEPLWERLAKYLEQTRTPPYRARTPRNPEDLIEKAWQILEEAPQRLPALSDPSERAHLRSRVENFAALYLSTSNPIHSPHSIGHQVSPPVPVASLFESLGSVANPSAAVFEMGPFPVACERALFRRLGAVLGWEGRNYDAICTHGGSVANLTALLTARNVQLPGSWQHGVEQAARSAGRGKPAIVVSFDAHYSVSRSAGLLGLGSDQVLKAPIDAKRKLDASKLEGVLDEAKARGFDVLALVGSAGSTSVGAFDPLEEMAGIAAKRGIWFHVDGAHGASLLCSRKHRARTSGIERADSIVWDAHKMLFVPALCTFVFYKDKAQSYEAFRQDAPYLFDPEDPTPADYDGALRTVECTKRPLAMGLWALWATFGPELFERLVDTAIEQTHRFWETLQDQPDFQTLHEPECNILCFRHVPGKLREAPSEARSSHQTRVRAALLSRGEFYVTSTQLDGETALRVTIMNASTGDAELGRLLEAIRGVGVS